MKKLLIADAAEEFRTELQEYLQDTYLIKAGRDGNEALQMMESFKPDMVVMDLLLPGVDGVTLLQRAEERGFRTTVLVVTRYTTDYLMDAVERLGVGYVIVKPCGLDAVAARLADMLAEQKEESGEVTAPDIGTVVDNVLRELSFQTHPRGYMCLREALLQTLCEPNQQVTKTLYPTVGKVCSGNGKQVEQAIRRAINQAWLYRNEEIWNQYFSTRSGDKLTKCPTNKVFIMGVVRHLAYDLGQNVHLRRIG